MFEIKLRKFVYCLAVVLLAALFSTSSAESSVPVITVTFDKESIEIGEVLTAHYEVMGNDSYTAIGAHWYCWVDEWSAQGIQSVNASSLSGETSVSPTFGQYLSLHISVRDSKGQSHSYESERIPVVGYTSIPPTITITFDKTSIEIGEMLTAHYEITGNDSYTTVGGYWYCWVDEWSAQGIQSANASSLSGETSVSPTFGQYLSLHISVRDSKGQSHSYESEKIPITNILSHTYPAFSADNKQTYHPGNSMLFRIDADHSKFRSIIIDHQLVPSNAYSTWSGSTYIELKDEYLSSLTPGTHTMTVLFSDGLATISFSTERVSTPPKTGDHYPLVWLGILLLGSLGGMLFCAGQNAKRR